MPIIDFAHVWNTIPFPAFIINSEFIIIEGNSAAEQVVQTSHNQMSGKALSVFFGINSVVLETIKQVKRENSSLSQYGIEVSTIDRVSFECNLHINPLDKNNENYLLIIQPNSFAQKINQSSSHRTSARSVTAMASMLAHEIRNPLAGISGAAASGGATIPIQNLVNNTNAPITIIYSVSVSTNSGNCAGTLATYSITVNPIPVLSFSAGAQTICSGAQSTAVNLTSNFAAPNAAGLSYSWSAAQPNGITGLVSSGVNSIPVQTLTSTNTFYLNTLRLTM